MHIILALQRATRCFATVTLTKSIEDTSLVEIASVSLPFMLSSTNFAALFRVFPMASGYFDPFLYAYKTNEYIAIIEIAALIFVVFYV